MLFCCCFCRIFRDGDFQRKMFSLLHFNIFCQDLGDKRGADYFPAEVGVVRFSLMDGLSSECVHALIKPPKLKATLT